MYVHRITFAAPDISSLVSVNYRCKEAIMPSGVYEEIISNLWEDLQNKWGTNVKKPVLVGYMKTKE